MGHAVNDCFSVARLMFVIIIVATLPSCVLAQEVVPRLATAEAFDTIVGLAISPDNGKLIVGNMNGSIEVLKLPLGEKLRVLRGPKYLWGLTLSPNGDILAGFRIDRPDVFLYDTKNWTSLTPISIGDMRIWQVAFLPDGRSLAVRGCRLIPGDIHNVDGDSTVRIWDITCRKTVTEISGHNVGLGDVVFSPDGKTLAMATGSLSPQTPQDCFDDIRYWNVHTGTVARQRIETRQEDIRCLAFLSDGKRLVSAGNEDNEDSDNGNYHNVTIRIWDVATGTLMQTLKGHGSHVCALIPFSDEMLISGSSDGTIRLWDLRTSKEIGKVDMGPANCRADGSIRSSITHLSLSTNREYLACSMSLTDLRIWRLSDAFPLVVRKKSDTRDNPKPITVKSR